MIITMTLEGPIYSEGILVPSQHTYAELVVFFPHCDAEITYSLTLFYPSSHALKMSQVEITAVATSTVAVDGADCMQVESSYGFVFLAAVTRSARWAPSIILRHRRPAHSLQCVPHLAFGDIWCQFVSVGPAPHIYQRGERVGGPVCTIHGLSGLPGRRSGRAARYRGRAPP